MAENETHVVYKALADFSALSRAARNARREIRELRAEEARLNAESAAGSAAADSARNRSAAAANGATNAVRGHTAATSRDTSVVSSHTSAVDRDTSSRNRGTQAIRAMSPVAAGMNRVLRESKQATDGLASSSERLARSAGRGGGGNAMRTAFSGALGPIRAVNKQLDKLSKWRPHIIPPFIALVPAIAGLLSLLNPLVASMGAAGAAGLGFASSLGRIGGAALGVIPALFSLISVVAAMKVAFGGVGTVFGAFKSLKQAQTRRGGATGGVTGGTGTGTKLAELTLTEKLTRAQEAYRRAVQDVHFAQDDLNDARKDYIKRLNQLERAVKNAGLSEMRAAADAQVAYEEYRRTLADPDASQGDRMQAEVAYKEALQAQTDVQEENKQSAEELAKMKSEGMSGDRDVVMAQRAVVDAMNRVRDAELDVVNVRRQAAIDAENEAKAANSAAQGVDALAGATNLYEDALARLSPSARKFVSGLLAMSDAWLKVRQAVQESFFSKIVGDLGRIRGMLPTIQSLLSNTAGAMGDVAHNFLMMVTSPAWKSDLVLLGKGNVPIIKAVGDGFLIILDAFRNLAVVSQPFLLALSEGFKKGAENLRAMIDEARKTGSLGKWLMGDGTSRGVLQTLRQWWIIIKNISGVLFNYSKAAAEFSNWLTDGLQAATEGWLKSSQEATKEGSPFKKWLEDIKPLLTQIKSMFGGFFSWFREQSMDPQNIKQATEVFRLITEDLGPKVAKFFDNLSKAEVGPKFVSTISKLVELIDKVVNSGATSTFFDWLNKFLDIMIQISNIPGADKVISGITSALAGLAAFTFIYNLSGLENLVRLITGKKMMLLPGILGGIYRGFRKIIGLPVPTPTVPGVDYGTGGARPGTRTGGVTGTGTRPGGGSGGTGTGARTAGGSVVTGAASTARRRDSMGVPLTPKGVSSGRSGISRRIAAQVPTYGWTTTPRGSAGAIRPGPFSSSGYGPPVVRDSMGVPVEKYVPTARAVPSVVPQPTPVRTTASRMRPAAGAAGVAGVSRVGGATASRMRPSYGWPAPVSTGATRVPRGVDFGTGGVRPVPVKPSILGKLGTGLTKFGGVLGKVGPVLGKGLAVAAGPIGIIGSIAGGIVGDSIAGGAAEGRAGAAQRVGGGLLSGAANGAGIGAMIGSVIPIPGVGTGVGAAVGGVVGAGASFFTAPAEDRDAFLADTGKAISDFFTKTIPSLLEGAGDFFGNNFKGIGEWLAQQWTSLSTWVTNLPSTIGSLFSGAGDGIWSGLSGFGTWLSDQWDGVQEWFVNLPYNIGYAAGQLWGNLENFGTWLGNQWNGVVAWFQDLPNQINNAAGEIWRNLQGFGAWLGKQWEGTVGWFQNLPNQINAAAGEIWRNLLGLGQWLGKQWDGAVAWARDLPNKINNAAGEVWRNLQGLGAWADKQWSGAVSWFRDLPNKVARAATGIWDGIQSFGSWLQNQIFSGFQAGYSSVPGHHNGGVIRRAGGGGVPGHGNSDTVPAMLTPGEYVLKKSVTKRLGVENLNKVNSGIMTFAEMLRSAIDEQRKPKEDLAQISFFSAGGLVPDISSFTRPNLGRSDSVRAFDPELRKVQMKSAGTTIIVEELIIQNPKQETVQQSLHTTVRKLNYIYGGSEG